MIKDKKLYIETNEWLVPIKNSYPTLQEEYKRLELEGNFNLTTQTDDLEAIRLSWLAK